jgi:hypothetical protein
MALERAIGLPPAWFYPIRLVLVSATLLMVSRPYFSLRAQMPWSSLAVGIAVFLIWVGPDLLFGPNYRQHWLFQNPITGTSSAFLRLGAAFIALRIVGSVLVVPVIEELFWRGWLMRWLINKEFCKVPLGTYVPSAFWIVAALFASEHGPYWEVGLVAGAIYNWWLIRTKTLADCILAHAVTNGLLAVYVVASGHWQYWL